MTTRLAKWGNSLGLRLPKLLTDNLKLEEGSEIELSEQDGSIIISPKNQDLTLDALIQQMKSIDVMDQVEDIQAVGKEQFWKDEG